MTHVSSTFENAAVAVVCVRTQADVARDQEGGISSGDGLDGGNGRVVRAVAGGTHGILKERQLFTPFVAKIGLSWAKLKQHLFWERRSICVKVKSTSKSSSKFRRRKLAV